jgi:predicted secreted protein
MDTLTIILIFVILWFLVLFAMWALGSIDLLQRRVKWLQERIEKLEAK